MKFWNKKRKPQYFMIYDMPGFMWQHVVTTNPHIYENSFNVTYKVNLEEEDVYPGYKHLLNMHKKEAE